MSPNCIVKKLGSEILFLFSVDSATGTHRIHNVEILSMKSAAVVFLLKQQQQEQQTKQQTKPPVDPFSCYIHPLEQIYSHWPCY